MEEAPAQNDAAFAPKRRPGINEPFHPSRWIRWLNWCAERLSLRRKEFESAVHAQAEIVVPLPDDRRNWWVEEIYPKPSRGARRRAWQAYWIGETIRVLQQQRGFERNDLTSGLESLAFGGYYGDLIATVALTLRDDAPQSVMTDAERINCLYYFRVVRVRGLHGASITLPDYDRMLDHEFGCYEIADSSSFNNSFVRWIRSERALPLHWLFEAARERVGDHDEVHAHELFRSAISIRLRDLLLESRLALGRAVFNGCQMTDTLPSDLQRPVTHLLLDHQPPNESHG